MKPNKLMTTCSIAVLALGLAACSSNDGERAKIDKLQKQASETETAHMDAIEALKADHAAAIATMESDHAAALAALGTDNTAAIDALKAEHMRAMDALKNEHMTAMESLNTAHAAAIKALEDEVAMYKPADEDPMAKMMVGAVRPVMPNRPALPYMAVGKQGMLEPTLDEDNDGDVDVELMPVEMSVANLGDDWTGQAYKVQPHIGEARGTVVNYTDKADDDDGDHLQFGYWLVATRGANGKISYGANTHHSRSLPFGAIARDIDMDGADETRVTGSANYAGPATGLYVRKEFARDGMEIPVASGQFTADADLQVYFGQDDKGSIAPKDEWSITGTVENFMDGGELIDAGWSLGLSVKKIMHEIVMREMVAVRNIRPGQFSGTTMVGKEVVGKFSGAFHGKHTMTGDDGMPMMLQPSAVVGEFDGHFTNGHVLGVFGARKVMPVSTAGN